MRYRLAVLLLFAVLPVMYLPAAPVPEPAYAILDIGPPPKGKTVEEYRKEEIGFMKNPVGMLRYVCHYSEVQELPSVARLKDIPSWLAKNLRLKEANGGRRIRLTIPGMGHAEQVTILNTLLRVNLSCKSDRIKHLEEGIRNSERSVSVKIMVAKREKRPDAEQFIKKVKDSCAIGIAESRAEIARLKQYTVVKWAK